MEDRRQPLPGFTELPSWAWRRMGTVARAAVVVLAVVLVGVAIWAAPRITSGKQHRSAAEARAQAAAADADRVRRRRDQAVHTARTTRHTLAGATAALEAAIGADLRARQRAGQLAPPTVRQVLCDPLPEDPRYHRGLARLKCLGATSSSGKLSIGYEVLGAVRPPSGRLFWCKTNPAAGEKANGAQLAEVPLAAGCFGGLRPGEHQATVQP